MKGRIRKLIHAARRRTKEAVRTEGEILEEAYQRALAEVVKRLRGRS